MKIALLGDSITQGLGSKKINFTQELQKCRPQDIIINLAQSGTTICYAQEKIESIAAEQFDLVIILYGNVDAQIRANTTGKLFRFVPRRFKGVSGNMLLPRPFYSKNPVKNFLQHVENTVRTVYRKLIWAVDGTEQWISAEEFVQRYTAVCQRLKDGQSEILCVSTVFIDEKLFPGSVEEYKRFNRLIQDIAVQMQLNYLDVFSVLQEQVEEFGWKNLYNCDHFHPNGNGYRLLASVLNQKIESIVK